MTNPKKLSQQDLDRIRCRAADMDSPWQDTGDLLGHIEAVEAENAELRAELKRHRARVQVSDDDIRAAGLGDPDVFKDCLVAWASAQHDVHLVTDENDAYHKDAAEIALASTMAYDWIALASTMAHDWTVNALAAHVGRAPLDVLDEISAMDDESEGCR